MFEQGTSVDVSMKFITFEGIEGCGKSTQARKLHEFFLGSILTREPGGTVAGEKIREILIADNLEKLEAKTEIFLNFAARIEHVEKLIKPALHNGKIIISDRFFDSTFVYQGYGFGAS
jgi:dTMP kinase